MKVAVALMWAGAALTLLTMPLAFVMRDEIRDIVAEDQPSLTESELDLAVTFGLVGAVVAGVIGIVLWTVNAVYCSRGASWSRILGTVLFGISVVTLPFSLTQPASGLNRVIQVLSLLISIGAVVALWLPDSSRFFRDSDRARRGY